MNIPTVKLLSVKLRDRHIGILRSAGGESKIGFISSGSHGESFGDSKAGIDDAQLLGRLLAYQLTETVARLDVEYTIRVDQITCASQIDTLT